MSAPDLGNLINIITLRVASVREAVAGQPEGKDKYLLLEQLEKLSEALATTGNHEYKATKQLSEKACQRLRKLLGELGKIPPPKVDKKLEVDFLLFQRAMQDLLRYLNPPKVRSVKRKRDSKVEGVVNEQLDRQ